MSKNKKDPIRELCKSKCEILPIEQTESEKTKYAGYVKRTTYKRVYEGSPYNLQLVNPEFDTLEIEFSVVGSPLYYEVYLRQLPKYIKLPPYTFMTNRGIVGGLLMNTFYEVDIVAYYVSNEKFHVNKKRIFQTLNESPPYDMIVTPPNGLVRKRIDEDLFFNLFFKDASGVVSNYKVNTFNSNVSYSQLVYPNQNNIIPNLAVNETYTLALTSFYGDNTVANPDYTLTQTHQMINETPVTNISFSKITGHDVVVNFTSSAGDLTDVLYTIFFNDIPVSTFGSDQTNINVSVPDLTYNYLYDVKIVSHYNTNNNSYLLDSSFSTLNETYVRNFTIQNSPTNVDISFDQSPDFSADDTYVMTLTDVSDDNKQIGNELTISGDLILPIDISNTFDISSGLVVDNVYNLSVASIYTETGNNYTNNFEFKTLNEGIIKSCIIDTSNGEIILSGASVQFKIVPFNGSSPIQYDIRISTSSENNQSGDLYFREPEDLLFNNVLSKNTLYFVYVNSIYATDNSYQNTTFDLSFTTRDEEALLPENITITPYGTYIEFTIDHSSVSDISTNFGFEINDVNANTLTLSGAFITSNSTAEVSTLTTHGHALKHDTLYRLKLVSKYGDPVREYYTFKDFTTLDEFPLVIDFANNVEYNGREASFDISGSKDLTRSPDYIFYDVSLSDGQNFSGNYNQIFPVKFIDLTPNLTYTVLIRSTFDICGNNNDNAGNFYDISYQFTTLNESELERIEFNPIDDTSYKPYVANPIQTDYRNPGNKYAVATLYSPSGSIETLYIKVESTTGDVIMDVSYTNANVPATQEISGLAINTDYVIYTTTQYGTGNTYDISESFTTLNEKEINTSTEFYVYTTDDTLAIDFVETGENMTYTLNISGTDFDPQAKSPLDFDIGNLSTSQNYIAYIDTVYNTTNNIYRSSNFTITPGFTPEYYIENGTFVIDASTINGRGFSTTIPTEWNTTSVVIAILNDSETEFYKNNPDSTSLYSAVLYLPSNLNDAKILRQPIRENTGPTNDDNDNNLYKGRYQVSFYAANHIQGGQVFSFGNVTDENMTYEVKLVNTADPLTTIFSQSFTTIPNNISFHHNTITIDVPTSYNHVEFQIERTGNEKNNLYIMDVSMISVFVP